MFLRGINSLSLAFSALILWRYSSENWEQTLWTCTLRSEIDVPSSSGSLKRASGIGTCCPGLQRMVTSSEVLKLDVSTGWIPVAYSKIQQQNFAWTSKYETAHICTQPPAVLARGWQNVTQCRKKFYWQKQLVFPFWSNIPPSPSWIHQLKEWFSDL